MSEIKLFNLTSGRATEIPGEAGGLEKSLQTLFENNLDTLLGIRFVASEHFTGQVHGGRIDSLGLDESYCPVIMEYKRAVSESVINQGLFYLDWLMDHKAEFTLLVRDRYGKDTADHIDWSAPRLVCVAADFTRYDEHAIRQIPRNIDLIRYRRFGQDLLALELASQVSAAQIAPSRIAKPPKKGGKGPRDKTVSEMLAEMSDSTRDLYENLRAFILGLGDDVTERQMQTSINFRRIKNFVSICVLKKGLCLYLKVDPTPDMIQDGFTRDVTKIGHWGTGNLEAWVTDKHSLKKAQPLIVQAYEGT